jgi:hypothetical protein
VTAAWSCSTPGCAAATPRLAGAKTCNTCHVRQRRARAAARAPKVPRPEWLQRHLETGGTLEDVPEPAPFRVRVDLPPRRDERGRLVQAHGWAEPREAVPGMTPQQREHYQAMGYTVYATHAEWKAAGYKSPTMHTIIFPTPRPGVSAPVQPAIYSEPAPPPWPAAPVPRTVDGAWACSGVVAGEPCASTKPRAPGASECDACHSRRARELRAAREYEDKRRALVLKAGRPADYNLKVSPQVGVQVMLGFYSGLTDDEIRESVGKKLNARHISAMRVCGIRTQVGARNSRDYVEPSTLDTLSSKSLAALCKEFLVEPGDDAEMIAALRRERLRPPIRSTHRVAPASQDEAPARTSDLAGLPLGAAAEKAAELSRLKWLEADVSHVDAAQLQAQLELPSEDRDQLYAVCSREALRHIVDQYRDSDDAVDLDLADRAEAAFVLFDELVGYPAEYVAQRLAESARAHKHSEWHGEDRLLRELAGLRLTVGFDSKLHRWWATLYTNTERVLFNRPALSSKAVAKAAVYKAAVAHLQKIAALCEVPWDGVDERDVAWQTPAHRTRAAKPKRVERHPDHDIYDY